MSTASTDGARSHARAQAERRRDAHPAGTRRRRPWRAAVGRVDPGRFVHLPRAGPRHPTAPGRPRRRRVRPPAAVPRRRTVGAPQRRRHHEGAVAGLPRRRPSAAVRSGPGAGHRRRRHLRSARHAVRNDARRARTRCCWPALKHGLDVRDVAPSASFFKGVRVDDDGCAGRSPGRPDRARAVELLIHLPVVVALTNTAHPLDPAPDADRTRRRWPGAPTTNWPRPSTMSPSTCGPCSTPKALGPQAKTAPPCRKGSTRR